MIVLDEVIATLTRVLQLDEARHIDANTRLLGGIPEFDSLAVASVVIGLEEQFGLEFDDDDINAELFETVGTLAAFVERHASGDSTPAPRPSFLAARSGDLYLLRHDSAKTPSRCVVFLPPFAEEMNRVRAIITATAHALNNSGLSCCVFDLHGTGDSDGDFSDARWDIWMSNIDDVLAYLRRQGYAKIDMIGIRLGALLAIEYIESRKPDVDRLMLWDPVLSADRHVDQFLRTRTMAAMMAGQTETVEQLRGRLLSGETVEVGGYSLHPDLATQLYRKRPPGPPDLPNTTLTWVGRDAKVAAGAQTSRLQVSQVVQADYEPYWSSVEPVSAAALVRATCEVLK